MKHKITVFFLTLFVIIAFTSCKVEDKPVSSILESDSLRNGSVCLYHIKDKSGKIIGMVTNYIYNETPNIVFVQDHTASELEEILRIKMDPKSLQLNQTEIVKTEGADKEVAEKQTVLYSTDRSRNTFYLTDYSGKKQKNTRIIVDSLVMEQETMLYLLNSFPFGSLTSSAIEYINTRTQVKGTESVNVLAKESKSFNRREYSSYKVKLSVLGATAWYMEQKPHILIEANLTDFNIVLIDWNEL